MRNCFTLLAMLYFLAPDSGFCTQQTFTLAPLVSYSSEHFSIPGGFNAGISAGFSFGESYALSASVIVGSREIPYDAPGQTSTLALNVAEFQVDASAVLVGNSETCSLAAFLGGGVVVNSTRDISIPAGALGQLHVPGRREDHAFLISGVSALVPLSNRVDIMLSPGFRSYDARFPLDFVFTGGIRVGLF
jgi:hypothetical protein